MKYPQEQTLRDDIVRYCRLLHDRDYAPGTSGNISARLDGARLLITPTGIGKWQINPEDLTIVTMDGKALSGLKPTSEMAMHLEIYRVRQDAGAVVHAHPPTATGFACAGIPLNQPLVAEFIEAVGCAPLAPFATPGTKELPESINKIAADNDAILLSNHGVVTLGNTLFDAYAKMELVEHCAKITLTARQLGREQKLRESDVRKLLEARAHYFGLSETPSRKQNCPTPGIAAGASQRVDAKTLERVIKEVLKNL